MSQGNISGDVPVIQTGPDASDAVQVDENMSFSELASTINASDDPNVPAGAQDVRNEPMTQEEVEAQETEQEANASNVQTASVPGMAPQPPRGPQGQPLTVGKHNLNPTQAERLAKILDEGGFELLDAMWGTKDEMWQKMHGAYQEKYRALARHKQEAQALFDRGQALVQMAQQMFGKGVGVQPQQQAAQRPQNVDMDDPIQAAVYQATKPLYDELSALKGGMGKPSAFESHQVARGWDALKSKFGDDFNEAIEAVARDSGLKKDPYTGEYDLSTLNAEQAFTVQNELVRYDHKTQENKQNFGRWFGEATKDLTLLPHSRSMIKSFWAQIMEDVANNVPVTPQRFRTLALQAEAERRNEIGQTAQQQAQVRLSADQPIVPNAGAAAPTSGGMDNLGINYEADSFSDIGKKIIARSPLRQRR